MTRTTLRLLTVGLVLGCSLQPPGLVSGQEAGASAPTFAPVPKFAIEASPIALGGDVRPQQYLGVVGPRAAWLGTETGEAEVWAHPLKLVTGLRLDFRIPDYTDPVRGADVARRVDIRPEMTTITYSHATFTVRQHILVPLDEPGVLVLLDVDAVHPLEIIVELQERVPVRVARRLRRAVRELERAAAGLPALREPAPPQRLPRFAVGDERVEPSRTCAARRAERVPHPGGPRSRQARVHPHRRRGRYR